MQQDKYYDDLLSRFESGLQKYLKSLASQKTLSDAMAYSLNAGGKRVRPVLLLAVNEMLGGAFDRALPFAVAVEMIHTYSLIHDDLPAMDNDDFRRGKPSNHKKFGEGTAILAGDGLLSLAFELCLNNVSDEHSLRAARLLAAAAGSNGMVAGQAADLDNEKLTIHTEEQLLFIHENKTAKMIAAPIKMASALNGGRYFDELALYGEKIGHMFQIVDDILDVEGDGAAMGKTLGKDAAENKLTGVKIYGLQGAKDRAQKLYRESVSAIAAMPDNEFLIKLARQMANRAH